MKKIILIILATIPRIAVNGAPLTLTEQALYKFIESCNKHGINIATSESFPFPKEVFAGLLTKSPRYWSLLFNAFSPIIIRHGHNICSVQFSPDSTKVVSASWDKTAKIVDATTGDVLAIIKHDKAVNSAQFSLDGTKVVIASRNDTAKIVSATTGEILGTIGQDDIINPAQFGTIMHVQSIRLAQFSPDSTKVATFSDNDDNTVKIVDAITGDVLAIITHDDWVISAQFSPDSTKVVSASWDKTAKVVDTTTGDVLAIITHDDRVGLAKFSPNGRKVVIASSYEKESLTNDYIAKISGFSLLPDNELIELVQNLELSKG